MRGERPAHHHRQGSTQNAPASCDHPRGAVGSGRYTENNTKGESINETSFETDLVVYEKNNKKIIPRVIIESKIGTVTTHDAITYSHKAMYHKNVIPFVRYGIMLGDRETYPLPGRLFRHGTNFDFLFSFVDFIPSEKELEMFVSMLKREIIYSRQIEEILSNSRSRSRKRYYMLQKEFHLEEFE